MMTKVQMEKTLRALTAAMADMMQLLRQEIEQRQLVEKQVVELAKIIAQMESVPDLAA